MVHQVHDAVLAVGVHPDAFVTEEIQPRCHESIDWLVRASLDGNVESNARATVAVHAYQNGHRVLLLACHLSALAEKMVIKLHNRVAELSGSAVRSVLAPAAHALSAPRLKC